MSKLLRGPSKYLVLAANNAEMRAGSGTLLSAGILTVQDGKFSLGDMRSTGDLTLPSGAVPVPGALAALWGFVDPTQDLRNLGTSPRFDVTGPLGAQMWKSLTGEQVDGVLALDPVTLQALIAAEGPVTVDGVQLNADNVVQLHPPRPVRRCADLRPDPAVPPRPPERDRQGGDRRLRRA